MTKMTLVSMLPIPQRPAHIQIATTPNILTDSLDIYLLISHNSSTLMWQSTILAQIPSKSAAQLFFYIFQCLTQDKTIPWQETLPSELLSSSQSLTFGDIPQHLKGTKYTESIMECTAYSKGYVIFPFIFQKEPFLFTSWESFDFDVQLECPL